MYGPLPENPIALQIALQAAFGANQGDQPQPTQLQQAIAHLEQITEMLEVADPEAVTDCAILGGVGE